MLLFVLQLEEVYLLEGLGPTPDANHNNLSHNSFVELVQHFPSLSFVVDKK